MIFNEEKHLVEDKLVGFSVEKTALIPPNEQCWNNKTPTTFSLLIFFKINQKPLSKQHDVRHISLHYWNSKMIFLFFPQKRKKLAIDGRIDFAKEFIRHCKINLR